MKELGKQGSVVKQIVLHTVAGAVWGRRREGRRTTGARGGAVRVLADKSTKAVMAQIEGTGAFGECGPNFRSSPHTNPEKEDMQEEWCQL